eukprot:70_1
MSSKNTVTVPKGKLNSCLWKLESELKDPKASLHAAIRTTLRELKQNGAIVEGLNKNRYKSVREHPKKTTKAPKKKKLKPKKVLSKKTQNQENKTKNKKCKKTKSKKNHNKFKRTYIAEAPTVTKPKKKKKGTPLAKKDIDDVYNESENLIRFFKQSRPAHWNNKDVRKILYRVHSNSFRIRGYLDYVHFKLLPPKIEKRIKTSFPDDNSDSD